LASREIAREHMGIISSIGHLKKALVASVIIHLFLIWVASYFPFLKRRIIIYSTPLFVDIVKIPPPKEKEKKKRVVYKKPAKKKKPKKKPKKTVKKEPEKKKPEKKKPEKKEPEKKEEPPEETQKKTVTPTPRGKISVEAVEFPFSYYLNIIQNKVTENWSPWGEEKGNKEAIIYFRVLKSGQITHVQIEKSSGSYALDQSALRAVALADPLPPLPQEFEEKFLGIHFGFSLEEEG